jgi:hypothetical protein
MTLAVILGLCMVCSPGLISARDVQLRLPFVQSQATQEPTAQEPAKPAQPEAPPTAPPVDSTAQKPESAKPPVTAKPKKRKKTVPAKPGDPPAKVVVRDGSTSEPAVQLSPALSKGQTSDKIQNVNQLLATTESNLKQISGRNLNPTQQDTVKQIRNYMDDARKAVDSGDVERGRNLAFKAHLLSDDLAKH